jgi:hypothetical protein
MPNLLDTYNTYIEYIEEARSCGLTMQSSALERYPTCEVEKVLDIRECDDKDAWMTMNDTIMYWPIL